MGSKLTDIQSIQGNKIGGGGTSTPNYIQSIRVDNTTDQSFSYSVIYNTDPLTIVHGTITSSYLDGNTHTNVSCSINQGSYTDAAPVLQFFIYSDTSNVCASWDTTTSTIEYSTDAESYSSSGIVQLTITISVDSDENYSFVADPPPEQKK